MLLSVPGREKRITAYYQGDLEKKEIAAKLKKWLPAYMIPNRFCQMETFPLNKTERLTERRWQNNDETKRRSIFPNFHAGLVFDLDLARKTAEELKTALSGAGKAGCACATP